MDDFKHLSKFEKLAKVQELNLSKCERHNVAVYLKALWLNDSETLECYESFGRSPRHFFSNKRHHERALLFGFSEIKFCKYGWFENPELLDKEKIVFSMHNEITIGKGVNDNWTFGISYSTGNGGGISGADVWGEILSSRKQCLIKALEKLKSYHLKAKESAEKYGDSCNNYQSNISSPVVKKVNEMLDELNFKKIAVQLELF